jgi:hypothetical protein
MTKTILFLKQSSDDKKALKTHTTISLEIEAAGTIGCWKMVRMF